LCCNFLASTTASSSERRLLRVRTARRQQGSAPSAAAEVSASELLWATAQTSRSYLNVIDLYLSDFFFLISMIS